MLTPYQFASNRPIDGIDLDGLEYLDSKESFIEIAYGSPLIKIENLSNPTQHYFTTFNNLKTTYNQDGTVSMGMERSLMIGEQPPAT